MTMLACASPATTATGTARDALPPVSAVSASAGPDAETAIAAAVIRPAPSAVRRDRRPMLMCIYCTPLRAEVGCRQMSLGLELCGRDGAGAEPRRHPCRLFCARYRVRS